MVEELDDELDFDTDLLNLPVDECGLGCHASRSRFAGVGACESAEVYIDVAVERAEWAREGALGGRGGGGVVVLGGVMVSGTFPEALVEVPGEACLVVLESSFTATRASCASTSFEAP